MQTEADAKEAAAGRLPAWVREFPELAAIDDPIWRQISGQAIQQNLAAGAKVFSAGDPCIGYVLVRNGQLKVLRHLENGREFLMYRLYGGSTCKATTAMLFAGGAYTSDVVAEEDTQIVLIAKRDFHFAFEHLREFRTFVCREFGGRIQQLIGLLESVMTRSIDVRLARWLLQKSGGSGSIRATHQQIATEIGSAREVVSRNLKRFDEIGWISLTRGTIEVLGAQALRAIASGELTESTPDRQKTAGEALQGGSSSVDWVHRFPDLSLLNDELWYYVARRAQRIEASAGTQMFSVGDPCGHFVLLVEGAVRVYKRFPNGRDLVLYRLGSGETCTETTSALLSGEQHVADAVAERDSALIAISKKDFFSIFDRSTLFRRFVLSTYEARIQDLIGTLETLMVQNVDARMARILLDHHEDGLIHCTHQELAVEIGTAREVVSRNLKQFEQAGWVRIGRRRIEILDLRAIRSLVED